jgi:hypothetical protein
VRQGAAGQSWHGAVGTGGVRRGKARNGSQGEVRHGLERYALVWSGKAVVAGWGRSGIGPVG